MYYYNKCRDTPELHLYYNSEKDRDRFKSIIDKIPLMQQKNCKLSGYLQKLAYLKDSDEHSQKIIDSLEMIVIK
ncbi:hypothetical protein NUSPORA_01550 [Nucleospora cyclopteri]